MTSSTLRPASDYPPGGDAFRHRHLIGITQLTPWEISYVLDAAEQWVDLNRSGAAKHDDRLAGLTIINAFSKIRRARFSHLRSRVSASAPTSSTCTPRSRA